MMEGFKADVAEDNERKNESNSNENNLTLFPDESIEQLLEMDLEERRRKNIERNRRMFEQLFQSFTQTSQENEEEFVQLTQAALSDQTNNSIEDEAQNLLTLEKKFITCTSQIRLLSHYLDRPKDTSLILTGLWPNQEKRQLVQAVCSIKSVHPIHVNLSEVTSVLDFIRLTAGRLQDTIDIYLSTGKKKSQRYHNALAHCRSIEHLVELLKEIHQDLHNTVPPPLPPPQNTSIPSFQSVPRNKIVFLFENYCTNELLGIASPPSMRLYEDLSLFTKSRFGVILLTESMNLTHYSYKEITVHFPNYTDDEVKQIAIQRLTSLLEETHTQQHHSTITEIAIRLKGHLLKIFGKILEVTPLIRGYGIHAFDKIYSIVILLLQKILQHRSLTSIVQLYIRSQGENEESDDISVVLNSPLPTMTQLRPLLHQIINPPTYDMTCPNDRNMDSYDNLPRRMRYLILAAFLAHINPKGTDNLKFIGEMTKKRKLSSAISGSAAAEEEKETATAQRQQDTSRLFSLERLLSIYAQLIFMSEKKAVGDISSMKPLYGKVVGYVEVLVTRKLLYRPIPFNLHRPMYGSNIPKTMVENIAKSMNICLNDFIYDQNQFSLQWL